MLHWELLIIPLIALWKKRAAAVSRKSAAKQRLLPRASRHRVRLHASVRRSPATHRVASLPWLFKRRWLSPFPRPNR